jgi:DUF971 family protein
MTSTLPTEINHMKARGAVRITWDDGHVGEYEQEYLRGYCPCALCQGHGSQIRFMNAPGAILQGIRGVGNYAVELHWQDGHNTGIFTFDYWRSLCPCSTCAVARGEKSS